MPASTIPIHVRDLYTPVEATAVILNPQAERGVGVAGCQIRLGDDCLIVSGRVDIRDVQVLYVSRKQLVGGCLGDGNLKAMARRRFVRAVEIEVGVVTVWTVLEALAARQHAA